MARQSGFWQERKKITYINWKGHPEINLLLGAGPWIDKVSHSPSKDADSTTFLSNLLQCTAAQHGKKLFSNVPLTFHCCGQCRSVMIWHCQKDFNWVIFAIMLKIVKEREKVTHISIYFKGLSEFVCLLSWFCASLAFQVWLFFFLSQGISEVLKRLVHGDMQLFHEVKEGMELDLNA